MELNHRIISIVDRLAHASTTDQDALQSVFGLRRVTKGQMPSTILISTTPEAQQISALKKQVADLRQKNAGLERLNRDLAARVPAPSQRAPTDPYSYHEVMEIIRRKFGKQNGALTLWADYNAVLRRADPNVPTVSAGTLQAWRRAGVYPAWAVDQLLAMPLETRSLHVWSPDEIDWLCALYLKDATATDQQLATACGTRFGCAITVNGIKSKLNILRKLKRIDARR